MTPVNQNSSPELRCFIIAGETSGDSLAAELIQATRTASSSNPISWRGAGGEKMADAGVEIVVDLPSHAVVGLLEPLKKIGFFRKALNDLVADAAAWNPDMVILVDSSGFNLRFAGRFLKTIEAAPYGSAIRPRMVYFISPQVWASRPKRATLMESYFDCLLSIFPFEKGWYADRAPGLDVRFVGHPLVDRYPDFSPPPAGEWRIRPSADACVALLPGSRRGEITNHWPVFLETIRLLRGKGLATEFVAVAPNASAASLIRSLTPGSDLQYLDIRTGSLDETLPSADLAIASSGTVTMECAWFRVPTVVVYKTSWLTYQIARRVITVDWLAMPNLLAGEEIFPELIQNDLNSENLFAASEKLLTSTDTRSAIFKALDKITSSLGDRGPGQRAAGVLLALLNSKPSTLQQ